MKLWTLRPLQSVTCKRDEAANPWEPWYDKCFGMVVRAPTEKEARAIASRSAGPEGATAWTNDAYSSCKRLFQHGDSGVIMQDEHAA